MSRTCGACAQLDPRPIASGIRYCRRLLVWRWAASPACPEFTPLP